MGAFIGYGDVGVYTNNSERNTLLDWFADHRCSPDDYRWSFCKSDGNRWSGCCIELENLIPPGELFIVTPEEYDDACTKYWPNVAQLLVIIEAITHGDWEIGAGSKLANDWRLPDDRDRWARETFHEESTERYLDRFVQSPFPGMDPYLARFWPEVRLSLVVYASGQLNQVMPPDFVARVDRCVEWEIQGSMLPGQPARPHIDILDRTAGKQLVTAVDFIDETTRFADSESGPQAIKFEELKAAQANLVEIDLHVGGYRAITRRASSWDKPEILSLSVRHPLPAIPIPLRQHDDRVNLRLQFLIHRCYRMGRYREWIDYQNEAEPCLDRADAKWADGILRDARKRK